MRQSLKSWLCLFFVLAYIPGHTCLLAQQRILVDLSGSDGLDLTPDNILNMRVQLMDKSSTKVLIKGNVRYRGGNNYLWFSASCQLQPGPNMLSAAVLHPQWQFSSAAMQDLFLTHRTLPAGTYEYCVTADPVNGINELQPGGTQECSYHKAADLFLINLVTPEDKAKLNEYYPSLSWIANYTFTNELTYRLRVAEIKKGQNPVNAVLRNQSVYDERNLALNSKVYPVYAKPLVKLQPYAWTVDAYYRGILLGNSETWQFMILDDTLLNTPPVTRSHIDIRKENGTAQVYAEGEIKLKYILDKTKADTLDIRLTDEKGKQFSLKPARLAAVYGDNRYIVPLKDAVSLRHRHKYRLLLTNKNGELFTVPFQYLNPEFK